MQDWCLNCGHEVAARSPRRWRAATALGGVILLAGATTAAGYAVSNPSPHDVIVPPAPPTKTVAVTPPPVVATPPVAPTPVAPPVASTPAPAPVIPAPATPAPTIHPPTVPAPSRSHGSPLKTPPSQGAAPLTNVAYLDPTANFVGYGPTPQPGQQPPMTPDGSGAVDDNTSTTAWATVAYPSPTVVPDVGFYVDLGSNIGVRRMTLHTSTPGFVMQLYGATANPPPADTLTGWTQIGTPITPAKVKNTIDLPSSAGRFRHYLVYVTQLPPNGNQVYIQDLQLLAP
jgi:hypothetical protein